MPENWTGEIVGIMHINKISHQQLADTLGWHVKYLSAVLNGKRNPKKAEEKIRCALEEIISKGIT